MWIETPLLWNKITNSIALPFNYFVILSVRLHAPCVHTVHIIMHRKSCFAFSVCFLLLATNRHREAFYMLELTNSGSAIAIYKSAHRADSSFVQAKNKWQE